jgi:hypothetical protein
MYHGASMIRATGVLLMLAGADIHGAPPAGEAALCVQDPSRLSLDETIRHCTAAIQSGALPSPDLVAALVSRCRAYAKKSDYARSLADCERAVQRDPQSALAVCWRGWVRLLSGNRDAATPDFERAILLDPNLASAYRGRGLVYAERAYASSDAASVELYDQAIRNFDEALRLEPDGGAYYWRGWCYHHKHSYDPAIHDFDEAIRLRPSAAAYYWRGWCYVDKVDYDRAMADFNEAVRLAPKHAGAYRIRGWIYGQRGEYSRAIRDCDRALNLHPDAETYRLRSAAYFYEGAYGASLLDLARAYWHFWVPLVLLVCLIYVQKFRKPKQAELPPPLQETGQEPEPPPEFPESEEADAPAEPEPDDADLDVLIRTGLRDRIAIGLAEGSLREAGIPFFVMGQNVAARQESGNIAGWWDVRVPREREAEAREIIRSVEEAN